MLLVQRFDVRPADEAAFLARARRAVGLLGAQPGCTAVELGRATEDDGTGDDGAGRRWVLTAVFTSVADYRRSLSPFPVREHVVPFLSEARADEPATFERRLSAAADGGVTEHAGILD